MTHKRTTEESGRCFVELAHTVPAPSSPDNDLLLAANRDIVERLAVENAIVHTELRLPADGLRC
ncbi:hypothetical protein ACFYW8_36045 [Streptomyces sp. NPDC002742]|uniref:hypothetical protein n=1 Tax=Streptomyces sp. NPDC002742 TaxID=3364663 RepID=UPI0036A467FF